MSVLKRIGFIVAWVVATFATATITLVAVGRAGSEVSERPAVPISSSELAARFAASTTVAGATSATPVTTAAGAETTVAADVSSVPTTISTTTTQPAGTTSPAAATSTTTTAQNLTYEQPGVGRVTISRSGSEVAYVTSVVLGSGYHAEVSNDGPEKVEVKFEGDSNEYVFTARVVDGVLQAGFSPHEDDD